MSKWHLSPLTKAQLIQGLRDHGLDPQAPEEETPPNSPSLRPYPRAITAEYEDLICTFLLVGGSLVVRTDLQLDAFTPGQDFPAIMAANSVNSADTGARVAILHTASPLRETSPSDSYSPRDNLSPTDNTVSPMVVLRVEHEIPVGPGLTSFQLAATLSRALHGLDRTLDAMVAELERLLSPSSHDAE